MPRLFDHLSAADALPAPLFQEVLELALDGDLRS